MWRREIDPVERRQVGRGDDRDRAWTRNWSSTRSSTYALRSNDPPPSFMSIDAVSWGNWTPLGTCVPRLAQAYRARGFGLFKQPLAGLSESAPSIYETEGHWFESSRTRFSSQQKALHGRDVSPNERRIGARLSLTRFGASGDKKLSRRPSHGQARILSPDCRTTGRAGPKRATCMESGGRPRQSPSWPRERESSR